MNSDPGSTELTLNALVEQKIVHTILNGSGGPDNREMTDSGLRFIRYLLSISRCARFGFLPNFKDPDSARKIAKHFIRYCGSAAMALQTMDIVQQGST